MIGLAVDWQDVAALGLGAAAVLLSLWLRARCRGGSSCARCAGRQPVPPAGANVIEPPRRG